jgi:hypothetical protein
VQAGQELGENIAGVTAAKPLPATLDIVKNIKRQVEELLDAAGDGLIQKGKHHHIIVSCQYSDASRQQLLLNFLLQECDSRILQHQEQAAAAKLDKAKNNTCCEQQCPWTQFLCTLSKIGTRVLAPLGSKGENRNSLACLRNAGSYHDFKFAESYCTSNTTAPPLASYVPKPLLFAMRIDIAPHMRPLQAQQLHRRACALPPFPHIPPTRPAPRVKWCCLLIAFCIRKRVCALDQPHRLGTVSAARLGGAVGPVCGRAAARAHSEKHI